jgi:hypothetical protein
MRTAGGDVGWWRRRLVTSGRLVLSAAKPNTITAETTCAEAPDGQAI